MHANYPQECKLYKPGHQVHPIQLRVKDHLERHLATVDLVDAETLAVSYKESPASITGPKQVAEHSSTTVSMRHHDALRVYLICLSADQSQIYFCPESTLLYIKRQESVPTSDGKKHQAWTPVYLAGDRMLPCADSDPDSFLIKLDQNTAQRLKDRYENRNEK